MTSTEAALPEIVGARDTAAADAWEHASSSARDGVLDGLNRRHRDGGLEALRRRRAYLAAKPSLRQGELAEWHMLAEAIDRAVARRESRR